MKMVNLQKEVKEEKFVLTAEKFEAYQHVDLTNDFMFKHCFPYKEILKPLLEEVWNKEIGEIVEVIPDHHILPT